MRKFALWGIEIGQDWELHILSESNDAGGFEAPDGLGLVPGLYFLEEIDEDRWNYLESWDSLPEKMKSLLRPDGLFRMAEIYSGDYRA